MRRYDDPVEVRSTDRAEGPGQFLWHGRVWQVRAVLAHWIETGAWWRQDAAGDASDPGDLLAELQVWRVEAGRGPGTRGVFDLARSRDDDRWRLVGCLD